MVDRVLEVSVRARRGAVVLEQVIDRCSNGQAFLAIGGVELTRSAARVAGSAGLGPVLLVEALHFALNLAGVLLQVERGIALRAVSGRVAAFGASRGTRIACLHYLAQSKGER